MRTSLRVMLTVSATVVATVAAAAYSQDTMKNPHDPLKPGREPAEDGGIAVRSGKRLHGSGHEIDDNIMQPGKQFHKPGRDIEEGTYDWDRMVDKPRRTLNEESDKKKKAKRKSLER